MPSLPTTGSKAKMPILVWSVSLLSLDNCKEINVRFLVGLGGCTWSPFGNESSTDEYRTWIDSCQSQSTETRSGLRQIICQSEDFANIASKPVATKKRQQWRQQCWSASTGMRRTTGRSEITRACVSLFQHVDNEFIEKLVEEMRRVKIIVKGHERRIKTLEDRLSQYEAPVDDLDD